MGYSDGILLEGRSLTKEDFPLAREILDLAQRDLHKDALLEELSNSFMRFSGCEGVEIHLVESGRYHRSPNSSQPVPGLSVKNAREHEYSASCGSNSLDILSRGLLSGEIIPSGSHFTSAGSFITGKADEPVKVTMLDRNGQGENLEKTLTLYPQGPIKSITATIFHLAGGDRGLLLLKSCQENFFPRKAVELYESIAQFLGVSIIHQRKQLALRERVKELTCLYGIARLVDHPDVPLDEIFQGAVELLPPAWLYPQLCSARIVIDGETYLSNGYTSGCSQLQSRITSDGQERGFVEVTYSRKMPELDEGPFLDEERHLLDTVAKELWLISDKCRAAQESELLQEQLRHADRLATIGQLSAGVAHELNEPLAGILGFAQLTRKSPDLPEQVRRDLERIINASLHAREIVGKLMLFARQTPPEKTWISLNLLVADGLYFIESRCQKSGIKLERKLEDDLPDIIADPGQIYQVLVNLSVNAIQSMPQGGCLSILTSRKDEGILLIVEDTGMGMSEEVRQQIFTPFFTTKDVGEGTGLGLSVVESIITSHGGSISVESRPGEGTKFTVYLPCKAQSLD